jgi:serine-type D-Ala-D-Ala carboxypeptidase/endopeptidase
MRSVPGPAGFPSNLDGFLGGCMNPTELLTVLAVIILLVAETGAQATGPPPSALPSDAEIRQILGDRIDIQRKSVGMVVGIITPQGRRLVTHGKPARDDSRPLNGDTVFEIASVTKIFTSLLLADMVQRGEVALSDPVAKHLPTGVKIPERNGRSIALVDLATQTSGLPFFPTDISLGDPVEAARVVARYTTEQLYQFLSTYQLTRDIGSQWEYSNLGVALLGSALANRAGMDYETLVRARITGPLRMESTAITASPGMAARLAVGHDTKLQPTPAGEMPAFVAAGSLRSTANDLLALLEAFLVRQKSALEPAMTAMLQTRRPGQGFFQQALGWWIVSLGDRDEGFLFHGGQNRGYSSAVAYDAKARVGVVVLSNSGQNDGGLAWHLMRRSFPLASSSAEKARKERKEITIDAKLLDTYAGQYQPPLGGVITIERTESALILKSSSAPRGLRLYAENERAFFSRDADLRITFQKDSLGRVTSLTVHFAGRDTPAPRIEGHQIEGK